jgi:2'-5' RNA ligase
MDFGAYLNTAINKGNSGGKETVSHKYQYVFHTSLVLMPPKELWEPFVEIKKNHMNPKIKRPPYPHITLLAPFVAPSDFDKAEQELTKALENIEPFDVAFKELVYFKNPKSCTLYFDPITSRENALQEIFNACANTIPLTDDSKEFEPHIGVGTYLSG